MEDNKEIKTAAGNIPSAEEQDKNRRKRKTARAALSFGIMVLLLVILFFAAVNIGSLKVTFPQLFQGIFLEPDETVSAIFDLRFPRIMISMLAGAAVPGIIGISSGASFAAVIITAAAPALFFFTPLFAFLGGVLAFFLVYTLSWKGGLSPLRIILVGVAVNSMFTGLSSAMNSMSGGNMSGVASIVNGNITMKTWEDVQTLVPYVIIGLILSLVFAGKCNLLSLEDKTARSLGVNVNTMRILISLAAVLLASISTAVAGAVSFLGLIVPHIGRILVGSDHKALLPFSMLFGAFTFLLADTIGRTIAYPYEISASVIMSVVGGPFFIILLRRSKKYAN